MLQRYIRKILKIYFKLTKRKKEEGYVIRVKIMLQWYMHKWVHYKKRGVWAAFFWAEFFENA